MKKSKQSQVIHFIQTVAEGLYPEMSQRPEIEIREVPSGIEIEVDVFDQSPGRMIGKAAQFRFALTMIISLGLDDTDQGQVRITIFGDQEAERSTLPKVSTPDRDLIHRVVEAAAAVCGGQVTSTETTDTAVISMMSIREAAADPVKPALNRIVRSIGRTRGFPAMMFISNG